MKQLNDLDSIKVRIVTEGGEGALLPEHKQPKVVLVEREVFEADPGPLLASAGRASAPVLVLGAEEDHDFMVRALLSGVRGFLSKDASASDVKRAAQAVLAGDIWAPRITLLKAFERFLGDDFPVVYGDAMKDRLTRREQDIVGMVQSGMSDKEIARVLGISFRTVKTHLHNIFTKLDIHSRLKLALASLHPEKLSFPD